MQLWPSTMSSEEIVLVAMCRLCGKFSEFNLCGKFNAKMDRFSAVYGVCCTNMGCNGGDGECTKEHNVY